MKKNFLIFTIILALSMINLNVYANEDNKKDKILEEAPDYYSKEHQKEIEKTNKKIDKYLNDNYTNEKLEEISVKGGATKNLSVPLYKQETSYYCGPASGQMLLKYVKGTLYTQSSLATSMGTTSSTGTYVYRLTNTINTKLGSTQYQYVLNSSYAFGNSLIYCIDNNKPIICHVDTAPLPVYNGYSCGHYVVSIGYSWYVFGSSGYSNVKYNDPNWNNSYYGTYTCSITEMSSAIDENAGYYIRAN